MKIYLLHQNFDQKVICLLHIVKFAPKFEVIKERNSKIKEKNKKNFSKQKIRRKIFKPLVSPLLASLGEEHLHLKDTICDTVVRSDH